MPGPITLEEVEEYLIGANESVPSSMKQALASLRLADTMHDNLNSGAGVAMLAAARAHFGAVGLIMDHLTAKVDALAEEWS